MCEFLFRIAFVRINYGYWPDGPFNAHSNEFMRVNLFVLTNSTHTHTLTSSGIVLHIAKWLNKHRDLIRIECNLDVFVLPFVLDDHRRPSFMQRKKERVCVCVFALCAHVNYFFDWQTNRHTTRLLLFHICIIRCENFHFQRTCHRVTRERAVYRLRCAYQTIQPCPICTSYDTSLIPYRVARQLRT